MNDANISTFNLIKIQHISLFFFFLQLACNITPAALLGDIAVVSLVLRLEWE